MNLSKRHFILLIISGLLLSLGLTNYLINHSTVWVIKSTILYESVARKGAGVFLLGYFSDLMWCVSFYLVLLIFIEREWISVTAFYQLLLLPFCTEFLQFAQLINGTADIFDILLYGIVCILFIPVFSKAFSGLKQMNYKIIKHRLLVANYYLFFLLVAIASTAPRKTYKPQPRPCITHAPITATPLLIRVYIGGNYTMKDLPGAQISGRDLFIQYLNKNSYGKYKLADGVNPAITFNITFNEYSGYYGAEVTMNVTDNLCKSKGKYLSFCSAYKRYETSYVTIQKLMEDIANKFDSFISNGWCTDCPSPCNPYGY